MQEPIHGGCLCGAIRYNIQFLDGTYPEVTSFCFFNSFVSLLPSQPTTCQCTQCRKNSGALVAYFITVASSNVSWIGSTPRSYSATPGFVRTFCKQCGSWLTWANMNEPESVFILTGSIDEKVLLGPRGRG
ncbi:hypothetical protein BDZ89DRAFT_1020268 [Hymenopellis radicata]|nr:hypothetical protein BDZ89DRAFT_1020268 [Hymenopellis radicata]